MNDGCAFCEIVVGTLPASIVWEDDLTLAFIGLRQFLRVYPSAAEQADELIRDGYAQTLRSHLRGSSNPPRMAE